MLTKKWLSVASSLAILGLLLGSCAPAAAPTPTPKPLAPPVKAPAAETPAPKPAVPAPTPKPAAEQPKQGGSLAVSVYGDPPSFDGQQETVDIVFTLIGPAYSGVLQYDPLDNTKVIGDLAERWETSTDGLTHTFYLRQGIQWHDGTPLTAEDIAWSLERHYNAPRGVMMPRQDAFIGVSGVQATNESTVRVTMKTPRFSLIPNLARGEMPMFSKKFVEAKGNMKKDVMGTGPFKFKSYEVGSKFEVVRNPSYFVKGRPYLDGITFYIIRDATTRFAAFRTGRLNLTGTGEAGLSATEAEVVGREMKGAAAALKHATLQYGQILFNYVKGPTMDLRVRKAISLAIDRNMAVQVAAEGSGEVGGPVPPGSEWAIPQEELLKMPGYRQPKDADVAEAKRLLAEAGYPNGFEAASPVRQGRIYETPAVFVADQLAKVGIKLNLQVQEFAVYSKTRTNTDAFGMMVAGAALRYADPDDGVKYFTTGGTFNFGKFSNVEIDNLFAKQSQTIDRTERRKVAVELQRKLLDSVASVILYWKNSYVGAWSTVKDYKPGIGLSNNIKFQDVWLAK